MTSTKTPFFLIHEKVLKDNIGSFSSALAVEWANSQLCYSVKTNALPWVLSFMDKNGVFAEVVSDEEYALAISQDIPDTHIVFNGPIKGEKFFLRALEKGAIINLDSKLDVESLLKYRSIVNPERIGIRVNVPSGLFDKTDIGYAEDGFRFGFSQETGELQSVFEMVQECFPESRFGLHLHVNSVTRSLNVYKTIAQYAAELIKAFHLDVSFIDIGGGFFGGVEGKPTPTDYIYTIRKELETAVSCEKVTLYAEPGSAIIGSAADLVTTVIDTKETGATSIVTTDGSRIHIDPLWRKSAYRYVILPQDGVQHPRKTKQVICGYTCMDHDRIMTLENERALHPGDQIVYQRVGAYTMTFGGAFIRYLPEVYVESSDKIHCVRDNMSISDYISLHSVKADECRQEVEQ